MKNPLTPAGVEPATFRFVAQHLNFATAVTIYIYIYIYFKTYRDAGRAKEIKIIGKAVNVACCRFGNKALDSIPKTSMYLAALYDDAHKDTCEEGTVNYCPVSFRLVPSTCTPSLRVLLFLRLA